MTEPSSVGPEWDGVEAGAFACEALGDGGVMVVGRSARPARAFLFAAGLLLVLFLGPLVLLLMDPVRRVSADGLIALAGGVAVVLLAGAALVWAVRGGRNAFRFRVDVDGIEVGCEVVMPWAQIADLRCCSPRSRWVPKSGPATLAAVGAGAGVSIGQSQAERAARVEVVLATGRVVVLARGLGEGTARRLVAAVRQHAPAQA